MQLFVIHPVKLFIHIFKISFMYPAKHATRPEIIFKHTETPGNPFYIKDAVDDIIEKVLASGGDAEFVDEGILKNYHKTALIQYY